VIERQRLAVGLLADHPWALDTVARWLHEQWLHAYGYSLPDACAEVRTRLRRHTLPIALVAIQDHAVVGTVSISEDISPATVAAAWCLSGLYVSPAWRRRKIATRLCTEAITTAGLLGLRSLCLYTLDQTAFFAKLGWHRLEALEVATIDGPRCVARMSRAC
jgi:predicted N-acetyltransferase YhbS